MRAEEYIELRKENKNKKINEFDELKGKVK